MNVTELFLDHLDKMATSTWPKAAMDRARQSLIDYLAVTTAGYRSEQARWTPYLEARKGDVSVIGSRKKIQALDAAFVNGFNAHVAELDDGHRFGMMHPGAPVISALLSIQNERKFSLTEFYESMVIGYEAAIKLARAVQPEAKLRGYHATGICGTIGAAMAVAHALSYDRSQRMSALATAATGASGLLEVIEDDSELKPYNAGKAAMSGLHAALFGQLAHEAPEDVLGGPRGFIQVVSGKKMNDQDFAALLETESAEIQGGYFKPYAACRHCHPAIEAALMLKDAVADLEGISGILVETYLLGVLGHDRREVNSVAAAKMSTPHCVADALVFGGAHVLSYSEASLFDPRLRELLSLVQVTEDEALTRKSPGMRSARITLDMADGRTYSHMVDHPKGEPENPMSEEELWWKMETLLADAPTLDTLAVRAALADESGDLDRVLCLFTPKAM